MIGLQFYPILLCIEFKNKSKFSYFLCTVYAWLMFFYFVFSNELCQREASVELDLLSLLNYLRARLASFFKMYLNESLVDSKLHTSSNLTNILMSSGRKLGQAKNDWLHEYKIEEFMFYFILCMISATLSLDFVFLMLTQLIKLNNEMSPLPPRSKSILMDHLKCEDIQIAIEYTKAKLKQHTQLAKKTNSSCSCLKQLFRANVYDYSEYFRFSKQFLNVNIISFILLFNASSFIINKSGKISALFSFLLVGLLKQLFNENNIVNDSNTADKIAQQIDDIIIKSCLTTSLIYAAQLLFSIRSYQSNVLKAYRGVYVDIPDVKQFSSVRLTAGSLHYSGYAIGFLMIGFGILFYVNLVLIFLLKIFIQIPLLQLDVLKYSLPFLSIFLLKRLLIWYMCRFLLLNNNSRHNKQTRLKNMKFYLILNHFNFFFDSFIIFFVSILRIVYSILAALFFFPRLDYRLFGLGLERFDMGFMSYIGFLHIEGNTF